MWETAVRTTESGRTVYVNNEPHTATKMIVSLITSGKWRWKVFGHPSLESDAQKRRDLFSEVERLLRAHYTQADIDKYRRRQGRLLDEWTFHAAVLGWHAGVNWVKDRVLTDQWPIFSDIWNPLDTYPDMDGSTALVHVSRMKYSAIKTQFGGVKGFSFRPALTENIPDPIFDVLEFFGDDTTATIVLDKEPVWLKKQSPHGLGHNPAWCNPVSPAPFRHVSQSSSGSILSSPDPTDNSWLQWYGQSPMLGYKAAYRMFSEVVNQIADVVERYASPIQIMKTRSGKLIEFDPTKPLPVNLSTEEGLEFVQVNKFPGDMQAYLEIFLRDMEKASFNRIAYGSGGAAEAAVTMQLLTHTNNYIVQPIKREAEICWESSANSILKQLSVRGGQYSKRLFQARSVDKRGAALQDWVDLSKFPEGVAVTATLKGAGPPQDKLQTLLASTNALNTPNGAALSHETILDEILEHDDPAGELYRIWMEKARGSKAVQEEVSPVITLLDWADKLRRRGTENPRALELAAWAEAEALNVMDMARKKREAAANPKVTPPIPPGSLPPPGLPPGGPPGMPPDMPPELMEAMMAAGGGPGPQAMEGVSASPVGAPPPGVLQPPTGPAPERGLLMNLAELGG